MEVLYKQLKIPLCRSCLARYQISSPLALTFILGLSRVGVAREERLVVLRREVHVVVRQRLSISSRLKPLVLGAAKQV